MARLEFDGAAKGGVEKVAVDIDDLVIAGWTGRDVAALNHHIEELKAIGVQPPSKVPLYYRVAAQMLTQADTIQVLGDDSSGEVEPVLIGTPERLWVTIGADHTDRKVETYNITVSKQMCDKPVAPVLWDLAEIEGHWDQIILRSWATIEGERVLYQEGTLSGMLPVADLIRRGFGTAALPDGCAMFCGTFAAKGGIRPAARFDYEIQDPVLKRSISHGYDIVTLPVLG